MTRLSACLLVALLAFPAPSVFARGGGHHVPHSSTVQHHNSTYATGVQRDKTGRIARSAASRSEFKKQYPCPSTGRSSGACPGYVIDHVVPLKRGGADRPSNMQWQTKDEAKEKDRWE